MITKYNFEFSQEELHKEIVRLTNQLWKLIPMRENGEEWDKQLDTVIIDIAGKSEIFIHNSQFLQLLSKLEGLKVVDVEFNIVDPFYMDGRLMTCRHQAVIGNDYGSWERVFFTKEEAEKALKNRDME